MRRSQLEKVKFDVLKQKAHAYDVDPEGEYMRPGNNPAEKAFQQLKCGLEMLFSVSENAFPSLDARARKRGPKYIRQSLLFFGGRGALALAHAVPLLYMRMDGRLSGEEPPELTAEHHRHMFETVSSFYPFQKMGITIAEQCLREFKVMDDHEPRQAVIDGKVEGTEYTQALLRGENPDENPELVALQRDYAKDFFIDRAISMAIQQSLNPNDVRLLKKKIVRWSVNIEDPSVAAEFRQRALRGWIEGSRPYVEYARLDAQ